GDTKERILMRKVRGSIKWVDDPPTRLPLLGARHSRLFCKNRMSRIPIENTPDDQRFTFLIRNRYQVRSPFKLDVLFPLHVVLQYIPGFTSQFDREIQIFHLLG